MKKILLLLACMAYTASNMYAIGVSNNEADLKVPTLTKLNSDDPYVYPEPSAYELESATLEGINTITKYLKDADGNITPIQYDIKYKTAGDSSKPSANPSNNYYYKWDNTSGHKKLIPATGESDADIVIYLTNKAASRMTSVMSGGDLSTNYAGLSASANGGAINNSNTSTIGNITGSFIGNHIDNFNGNGGAIYNAGKITNITGDFIANYIYKTTNNNYAYGGAIYNNGVEALIENITGNFIGNYMYKTGSSSSLYGGSIYNNATINNITGDFIGNYLENYSTGRSHGGAIYNSGTITNLTGDFIGNYVFGDSTNAGAAIYNTGVITNLTGDFIGNYNENIGILTTYSGAIYNSGEITNITGDFLGNYAKGSRDSGGGAIYNTGSGAIETIKGNFIENYCESTYASGGAIRNVGEINNITGDFIGNYVKANSILIRGGAIYNDGGSMGTITGNFIKNYIINNGSTYGGAIGNGSSSSITSITGDFLGNYIESNGNGSVTGGAIHNTSSASIGTIAGNFIENYVVNNGTSASSTSYGGAIHNTGTIGEIIDSSFIGNFVQSSIVGGAKGGAIHTTKTINLVAKDKDVVFSGNHADIIESVSNDGGLTQEKIVLEKTPNAIHMSGNNTLLNAPNLNLNASEQKVIAFYDPITSEGNNNIININKPGSSDAKDPSDTAPTEGIIFLNADMSGFGAIGTGNKVNFYNGTIKLGKDFDYFAVPINVMAGGSQLLDISNNRNFDAVKLNKFVLNNNLNVRMDIDLENKTSDTFEGISEGSEKINLLGFNIMTHTKADTETNLQIADADAMGNITLDDNAKTAYTPIYKYAVSYDDTNGILTFAGGKSGNSDSFNPSVLDTPVASQLGALFTQLASYQHGFKTLDAVAYVNSFKFKSMSKFDNKYANTQNKGVVYIPQKTEHYESTNIWYQPYTIFESVQLKNSPTVSNVEYGSYFGGDSELFNLKNGWQGMIGGYGGYNGSHQTYQGISIYQNGGTLGLTGSVFKNNFYSGITASAGALRGNANTMYGEDDFTTLLTGIATKTGYNLHLKESKIVLQPSIMIGYSYIKTFDYKAASGVNIHSSPINTITLAPEIRLIMNFKESWQPYISISGWWNIMGESKFSANDVALPEIAAKPYIQYGVGIQKFFTNRFSGFFQTMIRNGGRNGVGLNFGINYMLGKEALRL